MATRFIEATEEAVKMMEEVRAEYFPALENANIKVLFDTKKRQRGGRIVLGRILRANDLIRRLTDNVAEEGCDYIMFLDQVVFENINDVDRKRLIRHELRHCKVVGTEEKPKYKVIPHDIEDFVIEIELNKDNVGWAKNAAEMASLIYDQIEEAKKEEEGEELARKSRRRRDKEQKAKN